MPVYLSPQEKDLYYSLVWDIVSQIPTGFVATYGQIARMIQPPTGVNMSAYLAWAPRWVGNALAVCPEGIPWHRVINSQGKISLRSNLDRSTQRIKLESEGVHFSARGKVNLEKYGWEGLDKS